MSRQRLTTRCSIAISSLAVLLTLAACSGSGEPEELGVASVDDLATATSVAVTESSEATSSTSADTTTAPPDEEMTPIEEQELALLDLSACMRDEGIDGFPDVSVDNDGAIDVTAVFQAGVDLQSVEFTDAFEACNANVDGITFGAAALPDPADIADQLFSFTQCLRDDGVDVGDVGVAELLLRSTNVPDTIASPEEGIAYFFELDPEDPAAIAAITLCRGELVGLPGAG